MNRRDSHVGRRIALCSLLFVAWFLAACSTGGSSISATPTAASKPTPTPSPTPSLPVGLITYTGMGFTIQHPSNWMVGTGGSGKSGGGVIFSNLPAMTTFYVEILPNSNEAAPAAAVKGLTTSLQALGKQAKMLSIAPTVTVGGQTWDQAAGTTELTQSGQTVTIEQVLLATTHPPGAPSRTLFIITYVAPAQTFAQTSSTTFQPMLQSFTFTS
jgi:hypothetical protein